MKAENDDIFVEYFKEIKTGKVELCIFGAGKIGKTCGKKLFEILEISVSVYVDNNKELWGHTIVDGIICVSIDELIQSSKEYIYCICCGLPNDRKMIEIQLKERGIERICSFYELLDNDWVINKFWGMDAKWKHYRGAEKTGVEVNEKYGGNERIALYTCITNHYDLHPFEGCYGMENCDYYLITDDEYFKTYDDKLHLINTDYVIPNKFKDPVIQNRYCKMFGSKIFPQYRYSIYIDGNVKLLRPVQDIIGAISKYGVAFSRHKRINCIFSEGILVSLLEKEDYGKVKKQMERYACGGMPRDYGQIVGRLIASDHDNYIAKEIMEKWFQEFMEGAKRDQLSLMYVLYKMGIPSTGVITLGSEEDNVVVKCHN